MKFEILHVEKKEEDPPVQFWLEEVGGEIRIKARIHGVTVDYNIASIGKDGIFLHSHILKDLGFKKDDGNRIRVDS